MATKDIFESMIKFKEIYEYDMKSKQLFKNGEEVQMPKNEAKLFFLLVSNIEKSGKLRSDRKLCLERKIDE